MKTIEGLLAKSVPVRVYFNRDVAERLSSLCDVTGYSFSTLVNALAKVAFEHEQEIIKDAEGVANRWREENHK